MCRMSRDITAFSFNITICAIVFLDAAHEFGM